MNFFSRLLSSFLDLLNARDNLSLSNIRWKNLKYMLIFALAPVFANMQGSLFANDIRLFGIDAMTLMGSAYCIGAGVIFAFSKVESMVTVSRASVVIALAGFVPWVLLPESQLSLALAILFVFGLGGCAACASFSFTYALNNAERFFGAAMISLLCMLMQLDYGVSFASGLFNKTYLTILVVGSAFCLWQYRTKDFSDAYKNPDAKFGPALKLTLFFFLAHKLIEIFYTYLPVASTPQALITNGIVGIFVIGICFALQVWGKRSIWTMCNLFFIAMIVAYALYFTPVGSIGREVSRFFHGFEQMGFIASYYLLGCVFKKHGSFRLFRRTIVIVIPGCLLLYMVPGVLDALMPDFMPLVITLITAVIFIVFVLLSPPFSRHLFFADWSDDFYAEDMTEVTEQAEKADRFEGLSLTAREKEIAALLLQGLGTQQVASQLGISLNTAKFHIKNLYKKLDINSRTELFARFDTDKEKRLETHPKR